MARRFINQLGDREPVDEIFLVADKQIRTNRQGNLYLQMRFSDRTGAVTGMMWNANEQLYGRFENGNYLRVQGTAQFYNGALQLIVTRLDRVPASEINEADFITLGGRRGGSFEWRGWQNCSAGCGTMRCAIWPTAS